MDNFTTAKKAWLTVGKNMWALAGLEKKIEHAINNQETSCEYFPERGQARMLKDFAEKALGYKVKKKTEKGKLQLIFDWSMTDA